MAGNKKILEKLLTGMRACAEEYDCDVKMTIIDDYSGAFFKMFEKDTLDADDGWHVCVTILEPFNGQIMLRVELDEKDVRFMNAVPHSIFAIMYA